MAKVSRTASLTDFGLPIGKPKFFDFYPFCMHEKTKRECLTWSEFRTLVKHLLGRLFRYRRCWRILADCIYAIIVWGSYVAIKTYIAGR